MKLENSCKKLYHQSWIWNKSVSNCRFLFSLFHWKWMQRTLENILLSLESACQPTCVSQAHRWSTGPAGYQAESAARSLFPTSERTFMAQRPPAISLPPSLGPQQPLLGLLLCTLTPYSFLQSLHLVTCLPFQKAGCFEIMKYFHRSCCFLFLWILLVPESYWFPERNCLDFFIALTCSHWSHWQPFCLFFRDTKLSQMPSGTDQHIHWTVSKAWGA